MPGLMLATLVIAALANDPVVLTVESSLPTHSGQVRQFAFDGDPATAFTANRTSQKDDHFSFRFDAPVALKSVSVATGQADGTGRLDAGDLEVSSDGKEFAPVGSFKEGKLQVDLNGRMARAIRIKPGASHEKPLVLSEVVIASDPPLARFRYPVEFEIDVADAPEMQAWAEKAVQACVRAYPMINDELKSEGYKPPTLIKMALKSDYKGVAEAAGTHIKGSVAFFKRHPDDIGAMVHETTHVVQHYRGRRNPSWLVEGVADYVRFFKYEPGKIGRIDAKSARYNGSYRVSAAFLAYLTEKHEKTIVSKLNQAMRSGTYQEDLFKKITGKELKELGEEWKQTLH